MDAGVWLVEACGSGACLFPRPLLSSTLCPWHRTSGWGRPPCREGSMPEPQADPTWTGVSRGHFLRKPWWAQHYRDEASAVARERATPESRNPSRARVQAVSVASWPRKKLDEGICIHHPGQADPKESAWSGTCTARRGGRGPRTKLSWQGPLRFPPAKPATWGCAQETALPPSALCFPQFTSA